jgi:hypothetical protein
MTTYEAELIETFQRHGLMAEFFTLHRGMASCVAQGDIEIREGMLWNPCGFLGNVAAFFLREQMEFESEQIPGL